MFELICIRYCFDRHHEHRCVYLSYDADDVISSIFSNGVDKPDRIATALFSDDFESCLVMTPEDIDTEYKTLSALTVAKDQIPTKRNIKAFIEWAKGHFIIGLNLEDDLFPVGDALTYVRRSKLHTLYIEKSKILSDAAKPDKLIETTKWIDWYPTFLNFLRAVHGVNGVPLSYVVRNNAVAAVVEDPTLDYLENFVQMCHLKGDSYDMNNLEVHTYIIHFVSGNSVAEAKNNGPWTSQ